MKFILAIIASIYSITAEPLPKSDPQVTTRHRKTVKKVTTITEGNDIDPIPTTPLANFANQELTDEEKQIIRRNEAVKRLAKKTRKYGPRLFRLIEDVGSEVYKQHRAKKTVDSNH